ncbi:MAG: hypothetical protein KC733_00305 [Candidatus Omnitrophica bacterium]|nr:hypothetical protein [Candidatus Omnitrophota bacterium]
MFKGGIRTPDIGILGIIVNPSFGLDFLEECSAFCKQDKHLYSIFCFTQEIRRKCIAIWKCIALKILSVSSGFFLEEGAAF